MCIHVDGSVILWSMDDLEALCKVVLPSNVQPTLYTLSNECILLAGTSYSVNAVCRTSMYTTYEITLALNCSMVQCTCTIVHYVQATNRHTTTMFALVYIITAPDSCVRYLHLSSVTFLKKYLHQTSMESGTPQEGDSSGNFMQLKLNELNSKM